MALVHSVDLPMGTPMPHFTLQDPDGNTFHSGDMFGSRGLLVVFTCNHCPYANAQWPRLVRLGKEFASRGINTVAINPNINPDYPDDAPPKMKDKIAELGIPFPYLVDDTQQVARDFRAQCTPDPYLFDSDQRLVYHGRLDDNWQAEAAVTRHELRDAMAALAARRSPVKEQHPSMGCSIKWRNG